MKQPIPKYFILADKKDPKHMNVMIGSGKYDGVVFRYNIVKINENESEGIANMNILYEVIRGKKKASNKEFSILVGEILNDILEKIVNMDSDTVSKAIGLS
jgi:soluble P-type ATPase